MAERKHIIRSSYGSPGLLAYLPARDEEVGLGRLESHRFGPISPHFKLIGPFTTLYAPLFPQIQGVSSRYYEGRRSQARWLFRNCPDAYVGNALFRDAFKEDAKSTRGSHQDMIIDRPLLAVGHLPTKKSEGAVQRVMALPAGDSGQLLRIARMDDSQWQWGESRDAFVNVSTISRTRKEAEVLWEDDGLPIIQIKFAADGLKQDGMEEWLLVQKETSTVLLRPEYRETARPASKTDSLSADPHPSFIRPNPAVAIRHSQTGNRAHADVVLIPAGFHRPPQVAIVDDCGYWIVWDLALTEQAHRAETSLKFACCGHIEEGLLGRIPLITSHASRPHGLLFVGPETGRRIKEESPPQEDQKKVNAVMRSLLIIWNEERMAILDIETKVMLPKLGRLQTNMWKKDPILDVQRDPLRRDTILILTRQSLLWVNLLGSQESLGKPSAQPSILLHCSHLGTNQDDSRMHICRASDEDPDTICVFIYYPRRQQMCVFWLGSSPNASIPQWSRDTITLPGGDEVHASRSFIKSIRVDQAQLVLSTKPNAKSPGIDYDRDGVLFYQLSILWDDLSLQTCMCAISTKARLIIDAPDTLVDWLEPKETQQKRKASLWKNSTSRIFILPDDPVIAEASDPCRRGANGDGSVAKAAAAVSGRDGRDARPVIMQFGKIYDALQTSIEESMMRGDGHGLPTALFDFLRDTLNEEQGYDRLPLLTWREIGEQLPGLGDSPTLEDVDTEQAIEDLFEQNGEHKVFSELRTSRPDDEARRIPPVDLAFYRDKFSRLWLDPVEGKLPEDTQQFRRRLVSEIARDEFLSTYGVMIQDTPLLGPQPPEVMEESSQLGIPMSSQPRRRISLSSPGIMSSSPPALRPAATPSREIREDGAVRRLSMLCPGLDADKLDMSKQSKILSHWPAERGADPAEYISTIVRANEELLRGAKERLAKVEAKRRARADKYKRPAFMRQGLPDLEAGERSFLAEQSPFRPSPMKGAMSSQRFMESSQIQGVAGPSFAMSQPVAGAYGDRKKAKKAKRKSGFR